MKGKTGQNKKATITEDMEKMRIRREERKIKEERKIHNANSNQLEANRLCDVDYEKMLRKKRADLEQAIPSNHVSCGSPKIFVLVRKRPLSKKEESNGEIDCVSAQNPKITVHECKIKIDGITKYLDDQEFYFDNVFGESESTEEVYDYSVGPMIDVVLKQGIVTCFAYGQTGSGKTYTMKTIQNLAIDSLFIKTRDLKKKLLFYISFFEIYGGRLYDLLNNKNKLQVLDDKNGKVQIFGVEEIFAESPDEMRMIIDKANAIRTTHNTVTNETSSRSHAICNIVIKEENSNEEYGKLSLVDLAGSERAQETQSNDRLRRAEGAEINKSLLALKECIRALDARKSGNPDQHVPFRASKLTHVLRDSFMSKNDKSKIIMISCISPSYCSSNHSINTLRYSDRLKETTSQMLKQNYSTNNNNHGNNPSTVTNGNGIVIKQSNTNKHSFVQPSRLHFPHHHNEHFSKKHDKSADNIKEIEDINENVFNIKDDILNEIDFDDRIDIGEGNNRVHTPPNKYKEEDIIDEEVDDLVYLKKTVSKEGKYISDDFIKYHQLTELIVEDEDEIVNTHMSVIKDDAKMLTEEGELITKIKGIGGNDEEFKMDEYLYRLEQLIDKKIFLYTHLKDKLDIYKDHIKEEDEMRKKNPQLFIDVAEI